MYYVSYTMSPTYVYLKSYKYDVYLNWEDFRLLLQTMFMGEIDQKLHEKPIERSV